MQIEEAKKKVALLSKSAQRDSILNLMESDGWALFLIELEKRIQRFDSTISSMLVDESNWKEVQSIQIQAREAKQMKALPARLLAALTAGKNFDLASQDVEENNVDK